MTPMERRFSKKMGKVLDLKLLVELRLELILGKGWEMDRSLKLFRGPTIIIVEEFERDLAWRGVSGSIEMEGLELFLGCITGEATGEAVSSSGVETSSCRSAEASTAVVWIELTTSVRRSVVPIRSFMRRSRLASLSLSSWDCLPPVLEAVSIDWFREGVELEELFLPSTALGRGVES